MQQFRKNGHFCNLYIIVSQNMRLTLPVSPHLFIPAMSINSLFILLLNAIASPISPYRVASTNMYEITLEFEIKGLAVTAKRILPLRLKVSVGLHITLEIEFLSSPEVPILYFQTFRLWSDGIEGYIPNSISRKFRFCFGSWNIHIMVGKFHRSPYTER